MFRSCARIFMVLLLSSFAASAQTAPLAATPPMGWNSWNHFAGRVTEADVRAAADALVSSGMRDAGYIYVNIDDTWQGKRDANGVLHANDKFPDMKGLADYVHSKGLKLGIYSSPGPKTCAGYEGSYGHEQQDADLYASWGVDYLKYDLCSFRKLMDTKYPDGMTQAGLDGRNTMMRVRTGPCRQRSRTRAGPSCTAFASTGMTPYGNGRRPPAAIFGGPRTISGTSG